MSLKVLGRNKEDLLVLSEKKRIMIYGAGEWANDIYKYLNENGLNVDCFLVDDEYIDSYEEKRGICVTSIKRLKPQYDINKDAVLWAIASPEKTRWADGLIDMEFLLIWDHGFWQGKNYYDCREHEYNKAKAMLSDELSKKVMDAFLKAQKRDVADDIKYASEGTYFNDLVNVDNEGAFVDCGSFDGQSASSYWKWKGRKCKVFAFEPDPINAKRIQQSFQEEKEFSIIEKGCWSSNGILSFSNNGDMSSALSDNGDIKVAVTTIDEVVGEEKIAFIKMDIEGSELEALKGASKVIKRDMPILAISAYHRQEDLITLIPYLSDIHSNQKCYKLYLRHHGCTSTELVLYGIPAQE